MCTRGGWGLKIRLFGKLVRCAMRNGKIKGGRVEKSFVFWSGRIILNICSIVRAGYFFNENDKNVSKANRGFSF